MGFLDGLKRIFGRQAAGDGAESAAPGRHHSNELQEDIRVPEVTARELLMEMESSDNGNPLLLDCREHYERAQAYIPDSIHIPMNSIPARLAELDHKEDIVVYCAHGNRSYGVAGWLNQQGYQARSLKGGIVDWQSQKGPVDSPAPHRS